MNPQKNQGAAESPLLRDLQAEVSTESAPLLQFMLRHAGLIAGLLVLFLLVLAGTGVWRWHSGSKNEQMREALSRATLQTSGPDQVRALAALAEEAPGSLRFSAYLALAQSALANNDYAAAADAYAKAAASDKGAMGLAAALGEAGAMLHAGKNAEALTLLQNLQSRLPGEAAPQLRQMLAEAATASGQNELAARTYLSLARQTPGINGDYFRARAAALDPALAAREEAAATPPEAKGAPAAEQNTAK